MKKQTLKTIAAGTTAAVALATTLMVSAPVDNPTEQQPTDETAVSDSVEITDSQATEGEESEDAAEKGKQAETAEKVETPSNVTEEHATPEQTDYSDYTTEIAYSFDTSNQYSTRMIIDVPDELQIDVVELCLENVVVDTALIPTQCDFESIPLLFTDLNTLKLKLYRYGEPIGEAIFKDGKCVTNVKAVQNDAEIKEN